MRCLLDRLSGTMLDMSERRETLRRSFDSAADLYEAARPSYPEELFDDLVDLAGLHAGARLLEIGCATGKATRSLLERGLSVVCVELGARLAERARQNLAGFPVEIHAAPFETWAGEPETFDLVYAATAWHWLDPAVRYRKAHRLLRPGGHVAFWGAGHAFPAGFDPFFTEIQDVYDAIGESHVGAWPPSPPEQIPDEAAEIEASGYFEQVEVRRYVWERSYTAEEYIALLRTFSGHIALEAAQRDRLFQEVRRRIDARPEPCVRRHWYAILHVARRSAQPRVTVERRVGAGEDRALPRRSLRHAPSRHDLAGHDSVSEALDALAYRVRPAAGEPRGALVLLHGRGADEHDLFPLLDVFDPGRTLLGVTPRAPLSLPPRGAHWYAVREIGFPDPATFLPTLERAGAWLDALGVETGIPPRRTVLGGFSQGAVMTYALGLGRGRVRPAALIALSGFMPTVEGFELDTEGELPPVAIGHGTFDPVIGVEWGRRARDTLEPAGARVVYRESPMEHSIDPGFARGIAPWLEDALVRAGA